MTTATDELTLSEVKVEEAGPSCKRLVIEVSANSVDQRFEGSMVDLAAHATLPGFRPGKAPRKLIERRLSKGLMDDTKQKLVSDAYQKVVSDEELKVLGDPAAAKHRAHLARSLIEKNFSWQAITRKLEEIYEGG